MKYMMMVIGLLGMVVNLNVIAGGCTAPEWAYCASKFQCGSAQGVEMCSPAKLVGRTECSCR